MAFIERTFYFEKPYAFPTGFARRLDTVARPFFSRARSVRVPTVAGDILISRTGPDCVRRTQSVGRPTSRRHRVNAPAARICARRSAAHTGARAPSHPYRPLSPSCARVFFTFFFFSLFACPRPIIKTPAYTVRSHVRYTYYSCVPSFINRRCHTRRTLAPTVRPS